MKIFWLFLLVASSAYSTAPEANRLSGGECARRLNYLTSSFFGRPVNFSWLGHPGTPGENGWVRMSVRSFGQLFERVGLKQEQMNHLIDLIDGIRLDQQEVGLFEKDHPANLVSFAAAHFFKANTMGRDVHIAIAPQEHSGDFPVDHTAAFLFSPVNYSFGSPEACALTPHSSVPATHLISDVEGIILKMPDVENEDAFRDWTAELIGAFLRWDDLDLTTKSIGIARAANSAAARENIGWVNRHVGAGSTEGTLILDAPYFPLFIETRAEAAVAWAKLVYRRLGKGTDWAKAMREAKKAPNWPALLKEAEERALATVAAFNEEPLIAPYRKLQEGLYYGHAVKVNGDYRSVIVPRK